MAEAGWGLERLRYRIVSAVFHQPLLLRTVAAATRGLPGAASALSLAASATAVRDVLEREASFSRDHYVPVMLDGPFLIGERAGTSQAQQRACMKGLLPTPAEVAANTATALLALHETIAARLQDGEAFDLIDDYMMPLVWSGIAPSYGDEAAAELAKDGRTLFDAARWLGAQLMIGGVATPAVRQRALRSAALIGSAFGRADPKLQLEAKWSALEPDAYQRQRLAIGLLWVGHPATTQGGALLMQELLQRPEVYRRLRAEDGLHGADSAALPSVRERLRDHVLELLRFRPPFPILGRQAPREGMYAVGHKQVARVRAGGVTAMAIGALHDPQAQREDPREYAPGRHFHQAEDRYLMFGAGPRHCIARDHVVEILVTALAGLLTLDASGRRQPLRYAARRWRRIDYDGPVIAHMRLKL